MKGQGQSSVGDGGDDSLSSRPVDQACIKPISQLAAQYLEDVDRPWVGTGERPGCFFRFEEDDIQQKEGRGLGAQAPVR